MKRGIVICISIVFLLLSVQTAFCDYLKANENAGTVTAICNSAIAGQDYVFMLVKGTDTDYRITEDSLLWIHQLKADANGEVRVAAVVPEETLVCLICGPFADQVSPRVISGHTFTGANLPKSLSLIEKEAFMGTSFQAIYLSDRITSIGSAAFKNCRQLEYIVIPDSVVLIENDAFDGCSKALTIACGRNSIALNYAINHGYRVEFIN